MQDALVDLWPASGSGNDQHCKNDIWPPGGPGVLPADTPVLYSRGLNKYRLKRPAAALPGRRSISYRQEIEKIHIIFKHNLTGWNVPQLNPLDQYCLTFFSGLPGGPLPYFNLVTQLGEPLVLITLSALAFVFGKGKVRAMAAILLIGLFLGTLVTSDVKNIVERPRPDDARIMDNLVIASYSFPSGHALLAFLAASIIGGFLGWKWRLAGYVVAAPVAVSRLYLGVHYATDAIGGALIGLIVGEVIVYFACRTGICENAGLAGALPFSWLKCCDNALPDGGRSDTIRAGILYRLVIAAALVL
jgi:undecaprenyl-diphosphatase